jgi:HSP20 family molecular chaperone IbpA
MIASLWEKNIAMRVDKELMHVLAQSADVVNTINGGMSVAHIKMHTLKDHYLITVRVPGVSEEALKLEMHEGNLFVFQQMTLDTGLRIPYLVASITVSENVNKEAISANYEGRRLHIFMPFDAPGFDLS